MIDHFDLAVRSLSKFVYDQMRIVATKVMEEHWDFDADPALQIALAVGSADQPARDVLVVMDFGALGLALYDLVTANVAAGRIIIFVLLASTQALHRPIRPANRHDICFSYE